MFAWGRWNVAEVELGPLDIFGQDEKMLKNGAKHFPHVGQDVKIEATYMFPKSQNETNSVHACIQETSSFLRK